MINGDIHEFMDKLWGGEELIFICQGKKLFSQGYVNDNGEYVFELQEWSPHPSTLWRIVGKSNQDSLNAFLNEPLFDGKKFWDVEKDIEWVDE